MAKLTILLPAAGIFLAAVLCGVLLYKRLYRQFPWFFSYVGMSIVLALGEFMAPSRYAIYLNVYSATEAVYSVLAILALHEVFRWVFLEFYRRWSKFWLLFPGAIALALGAAAWSALIHPPHSQDRWIVFILDVGIGVKLIQLGLFALFFALVLLFGLTWWNYSFAIVLGFAISALGELASYWTFSEFGTRFASFTRFAAPVAYIISVVFWLTVFIRPEPEFRLDPGITPQQLLEEVKQYGRILERMRGR